MSQPKKPEISIDDDWRDLMAFWAKEHPGLDAWEGVRVQWGETFRGRK